MEEKEETSDSECFESADEDFNNIDSTTTSDDDDDDDEKTIASTNVATTTNIATTTTNIATLTTSIATTTKCIATTAKSIATVTKSSSSVIENSRQVIQEKTKKKKDISSLLNKYLDYDDNVNSTTETAAETTELSAAVASSNASNSNIVVEKHKTKSKSKSNDNNCDNDTDDNKNAGKEDLSSAISELPEMCECWEPGVNYPMEEYKAIFGGKTEKDEGRDEEDINLNVKAKDEVNNEDLMRELTRPTACWEPGMNYPIEQYNAMFPEKTIQNKNQCNVAEKEVKVKADLEVNNEDLMSDELTRPTACWEPGMNYPIEKKQQGEKNSKLSDKKQQKQQQQIEKEETNKSKKAGKVEEQETKDNTKQGEDEEDDLWNDDELDWGVEANKDERELLKQELQENQQLIINKEKDSNFKSDDLWNDDENAWETIENENQTKQENKEDKKTPASALDLLTSSLEEKENKNSEDSSLTTSWSSWGKSWTGFSSVLSTATASVSNLTSQVSQGLSTVLETGIGIPDPQELARIHKQQEEQEQQQQQEKSTENEDKPNEISSLMGLPLQGLGRNLVSGVSKIGTKVITGGLDTLETIGKQTIKVLQENDPHLKNKLLMSHSNRPNLSQILREAKERTINEEQQQDLSVNKEKRKKANYESLFDDHQGLVHLEALEILSRQCEIKIENLLSQTSLDKAELRDLQETFEQVKELCELPNEEDEEEDNDDEEERRSFDQIAKECEEIFTKNLDFQKEIFVYKSFLDVWKNVFNNDEDAIEVLAHLTAIAMEQYHKIGELLLVKDKSCRSTADEADALVNLTQIFIYVINDVSVKYLNKLKNDDGGGRGEDKELITNVFYEAANSCSYVKNAFKLLIPVLQIGTV